MKHKDSFKDFSTLYVVLLEFDKKLFFKMYDDGNGIQGFRTEKEAQDYYLEPYRKAMKRSYEAAMSACVHNIMFNPVIIAIKNQAQLKKLLTMKQSELNCVAGWCIGAEAKKEARKLYKKGKAIALNIDGICKSCLPNSGVALDLD